MKNWDGTIHISVSSIRIGFLWAQNLDPQTYPPNFEENLAVLLEKRKEPLSSEEEERRKKVRDMLRHGRYKPTGRGKPANEYLLREALKESFPRINSFVDINNFISLKYILPISLWDLDKAGVKEYEIRWGKKGESYIFNQGGQIIDLEDLLLVAKKEKTGSVPIANPVKDSLDTKTDSQTRNIGAVVYGPEAIISEKEMEKICQEFLDLLLKTGKESKGGFQVF